MNKKTYIPFAATHPGEMIKDELKERGITQKQLAEQTGIKPSVISETVNGKRSVSLKRETTISSPNLSANLVGLLVCR